MATPQQIAAPRISLPFGVGADGGVRSTTVLSAMAADELYTILMTFIGSRVMEPAVGSGAVGNTFASMNDAEIDVIMDDVRTALSSQFTLGKITSVDLQPNNTGHPTEMDIKISFTPNNLSGQAQVAFSI